ncbi:Pantoate--beta-alanine ligase [Hyaloraphidium curvatum]|nr:Pantoate--beta-alanine ligase [Hyaloraphidium curvatum]
MLAAKAVSGAARPSAALPNMFLADLLGPAAAASLRAMLAGPAPRGAFASRRAFPALRGPSDAFPTRSSLSSLSRTAALSSESVCLVPQSRSYPTSRKPNADMAVLKSPAEMAEWARKQRQRGLTLGLVPTMGALHGGHLALCREARRHADLVVVSVFVNPLQFNSAADFSAYPRPIDDDVAMCRAEGVDAVYAPTAAAMYPPGFQTHVEPGALAAKLEGEHRPGHFKGVATVVTKLLCAVGPDAAVFGEKDFQQLAIIRRMARDLDLGVEIVGMPTVREPDGLAMSSRNRRLSPEQRAAAVCISKGLLAAKSALAEGELDAKKLADTVAAVINAEPLARLEYVEVVDPDSLEHVDAVDTKACVLVAAWFGEVRLIDNMVISRA